MRPKAIQDLTQLTDADLLIQAARGMKLCAVNAAGIYHDCRLLAKHGGSRGLEILSQAAEEEAAKVLILLDAVRCPRARRPRDFARQVKYFNDHLAKGIYAQYCDLTPATFGEVRQWIDLEREEYFLDGPNDVDWIFHNEILSRREAAIYVDYVEYDGEHAWSDPSRQHPRSIRTATHDSAVLRLVHSFLGAGWLEPPALEVIAGIWRPVEMQDSFSWGELQALNSETASALRARNMMRAEPAIPLIIREWLFPLHSVELSKNRTESSALRRAQDEWAP